MQGRENIVEEDVSAHPSDGVRTDFENGTVFHRNGRVDSDAYREHFEKLRQGGIRCLCMSNSGYRISNKSYRASFNINVLNFHFILKFLRFLILSLRGGFLFKFVLLT